MYPSNDENSLYRVGMAITIREAAPQDADVLLTLIDALADYEKLPRPSREARSRLRRDGFIEPREFRPFIADLDAVPVGYAVILHTYSSFLALPTLYIEDIFVLPEARERGVGATLFRFLARLALDEGCGRMEWMVLDWNHLAIRFYERLGARQLREWLPYRLTRDELTTLLSE